MTSRTLSLKISRLAFPAQRRIKTVVTIPRTSQFSQTLRLRRNVNAPSKCWESGGYCIHLIRNTESGYRLNSRSYIQRAGNHGTTALVVPKIIPLADWNWNRASPLRLDSYMSNEHLMRATETRCTSRPIVLVSPAAGSLELLAPTVYYCDGSLVDSARRPPTCDDSER